jgi:threonine dehydratase
MFDIELEHIRNAREAIKGKALYTPLIPYTSATTLQNHPIFFKAENLQPSGSFKIRGATYCLSLLSDEQKKAGVIAFSTGNHAQAVAMAAKQMNVKATIVMSPDALDFKVKNTKKLGAEVIIVPLEERLQFTQDLAKSKGYYFIPPYDHPDVITGQGTIGLEILEKLSPAAIFVPVGGGGLISGIAVAIKKSDPSVLIIGVEPEVENDAYHSFKKGHLFKDGGKSQTIADAVKIPSLGHLTYPLIQKYVDDIITVNEEQIAKATISCNEFSHLFTEPSGALALAGALIYQPKLPEGKPVVCILSGGNTTIKMLSALGNKESGVRNQEPGEEKHTTKA